MKFYLTKAAQRAAEGQAPKAKPAKAEKIRPMKAAKPAKAPKSRARRSTGTVVPTGSPVMMDAPVTAPVATAPFTPPAPQAPMSSAAQAPAAGMVAPQAPAPKRGAKKAEAAVPAASPLKKTPKGVIAIGGLPRVDLLPPEVRAERRAGVNVRRAWTAVAGLVIIVGLASGIQAVVARSEQTNLASANKATAGLLQEANQYQEAKTVQNQVDLIDAARKVGGSTDIDWPVYLAKVQATLPKGMELVTTTIDSASPVQAYAQSTTPLEGQRVATLTFSATSTSLPDVTTWLQNLASLPGYADAAAGSVTLSSGAYTATVVVHITEKAFSGVYTKAGK